MRLIQHPNCLLASAAMVMETSPQAIIDYLGHDGSEITFPELEPPGNLRGFSFQEIIDFAYYHGYNVIPIYGMPCVSPDGKYIHAIDTWRHFKNSTERFFYYLKQHRGIIIGKTTRYDHAVAWGGSIYDPKGEIYTLEEIKFSIKIFWIFTKN